MLQPRPSLEIWQVKQDVRILQTDLRVHLKSYGNADGILPTL